jgi:hypothetical protein
VEVVLLSPFSAATMLWRIAGAAGTLGVVVKATFELVPDAEATLARDQEPIAGDRRHGRDPRASLAMAGDYAPRKEACDIVVVGHAYAPRGVPVDALACRVTVGPMTKALAIRGDRKWTGRRSAPEPGPPEPFTRFPLRYELAARTVENPVGLDPETTPVPGARALPNIEPYDAAPGAHALAGFGPIAPEWAPRSSRAGAGSAWARELCPLDPGPASLRVHAAPPEGFDAAFFNVAPPDQRAGAILPGQDIVLENLDPELPLLETRLPFCAPEVFYMHPSRSSSAPVALSCDTLVIDSDRRLAMVSFRGEIAVELAGADVVGRILVTSGAPGQARARPSSWPTQVPPAGDGDAELTRPIVWPEAARLAMPFAAEPADLTVELDPGAASRAPLPFVRGGSAAPILSVPSPAPRAPHRPADGLTLEQVVRPAALRSPLPFEVTPPKRLAEDVSLEEAAAIAAAIDQDPEARAAVLDDARLDAGTLAEAVERAQSVIRADTSRGSTASLARWDAAWVDAVERLRGPILPAEYAAIAVAAERGTADAALVQLRLGRGCLLPVERTFLRRMVADLALHEQIVQAVAAARRAP